MTNWRLIREGAFSGAWNMARDEALLLNQDATTSPVLRFYDWNPSCISLGRLQKDTSFIPTDTAFDWVRRPTGGRAVLHQHEITYCAVIHESYLPRESRSVIGAYNWLSTGFIAGLQTLGVQAQLSAAHARSATVADNCFRAAAQCDFLVDGRKLIGAAQCRNHGVILQHGAILLEIDSQAWSGVFGDVMNDAVSLRSLGVEASRETIVEALAQGLARSWNVALCDSQLNDTEVELASRLHSSKYSNAEWNLYGRAGVKTVQHT